MKQKTIISRSTVVSIVAFVIAPFLSFITALFRLKKERNIWVIFFFYLVFGICFTINQKTGFDSIRYVEFFNSINANSSLSDIYISNIINNGVDSEVYFPIVACIAKHISGDNYHIMFLLFAVVFSVFTVKAIKIFYEAYHPQKWWLYTLAITLLITNNFIFNINGMRFWTAAWMLAYGVLSFCVNKDKIGLVWILITPLIHSTFLFPITILLVSFFFGKAERVWILFLWLSVPFSYLSLEMIPFISAYIPDIYISKFDFYTDTHYIEQRASGVGFTYLENFLITCKMLVEAFVLYKLYKIKKHDEDWIFRRFFEFTIMFVTLSNFLSPIPSVGRYIIVGFPFVLFFVWTNLNRQLFRNCLILLAITMSFSILDLFLKKVLPTIPSDIFYMNIISLISDHL